MTKVNLQSLASIVRTGDDSHKYLVNVIMDLRGELSDAEFLVHTLEHELKKLRGENNFLMQQMQEES